MVRPRGVGRERLPGREPPRPGSAVACYGYALWLALADESDSKISRGTCPVLSAAGGVSKRGGNRGRIGALRERQRAAERVCQFVGDVAEQFAGSSWNPALVRSHFPSASSLPLGITRGRWPDAQPNERISRTKP